MKIEYLAIISAENSFCRDTSAFKSFLQSDSDIKITNKKIKHQTLEVEYELQTGHNEKQNHVFYHLRLKSDSGDIDAFSRMSRAIRKLLHMASDGNVQNLWDDISFHYSQISYPYIHEIENLMRKLITKFMLTNVGLGWTKDTIPEDIRKSSRLDKNGSSNNYLYEVDFIQLSDFLFSEYRTLEISALIKKISEIKTSTVEMSEISDFIPKSNWKRYFEPHVDCDATYLESRWKKLYELRCKIAHNNTFNKADHELTTQLSKEVKEKLEKAIMSLDAISVPEEEREELVESVIGHANQEAAALLSHWRDLENTTRTFAKNKNFFKKYDWKNIPSNEQVFISLLDNNVIDKETFLKARELQKFRNHITHGHFLRFHEHAISSHLDELDKLTQELDKKLKSQEDDSDDRTT
ncbi:hypothetical protein ACSVIJ_13065 [Pseudomonas sp. NCHU5208]|uniref:hypothetical protein n=1 Tax=unclassified Pseudomonas TaxID=196821 RepID=UPI003F9C1586